MRDLEKGIGLDNKKYPESQTTEYLPYGLANLFFLGNSTNCQMLGIVIQTASKTVVFDGGTWQDASMLADFLENNAHCHVDAWFFTHPHHDHIGAYTHIRRDYPNIIIDRVYSHFPSLEILLTDGYRTDEEKQLWLDFENLRVGRSQYVQAGEMYAFDDVSVSVLRVFNPSITANIVNNSSTVYRIDGPNKRVLILGDLGIEGGNELIETLSTEELLADYTQMAHHGQCGVDYDFYKYIQPKACLWPSPEWLWNNDVGEGFDTGPFQTVRTREWMEELGVTEHIIEKDGITKIPL